MLRHAALLGGVTAGQVEAGEERVRLEVGHGPVGPVSRAPAAGARRLGPARASGRRWLLPEAEAVVALADVQRPVDLTAAGKQVLDVRVVHVELGHPGVARALLDADLVV